MREREDKKRIHIFWKFFC